MLMCWGWASRETCPCHTNPNHKRALEGTWAGRDPRDPVRTWWSHLPRETVGDAHVDTPRRGSCGSRLSSVDRASAASPSDAVSGSDHIRLPQDPSCRLGPGSQRAGTDSPSFPKQGHCVSPPYEDKPAEKAGAACCPPERPLLQERSAGAGR